MESVRGATVPVNQIALLVQGVSQFAPTLAVIVVVVRVHVRDVLVPVLPVLLVLTVQDVTDVRDVQVVIILVLQDVLQIVRRAVRITVAQVVRLRLDVALSEHK